MDRFATRARPHVPLLEELLNARGIRGEERRSQVADGFPMLGDLAELLDCSQFSELATPMIREDLSQSAKSRAKFPEKRPNDSVAKLRTEDWFK